MRAIAVLLVSGLLLSANRADAQTLTTGKAGGLPKAIRKITEAIDKHLAADWAERNITPAAVTDDAEFCRRVFLDILGRIPKPMEVRDFEDDKAADKLKAFAEKEKLKNVILSVDNPSGPNKYNVSKEADLTIVLYTERTAKANMAFEKGKITDKDITAVEEGISKLEGKTKK